MLSFQCKEMVKFLIIKKHEQVEEVREKATGGEGGRNTSKSKFKSSI